MRHGLSPKDACLDALKRVARNFNNNESRLAQFDLSFYALRRDGEYAGASLWSAGVRQGRLVRREFVVNQGGKGRLEPTVYLLERKLRLGGAI
jgi:N4-(beta-N-acetylglucosaminyl)-L-asparaginase